MRRGVAVACSVVIAWGAAAVARTPACDGLGGRELELAERILDSEYLYACCDDTISACLAQQPTCALAARLADTVCRRVAAGQDEAGIRRALSRRARSMVGSGAPAEVDLAAAATVGPEDAPVTVVIYACARCPYCSRLIPELHRAVTGGPLAGEVRLAFRIFPIRGHEGSTEAGLAFAAAAELDAFWPFLLHAYRHFDDFAPGLQPAWAEAVGLDRAAFEALTADPATREALVASKKEGLVNGVEETPTFFVNGRRWVGDLTADELLDAFEEEAERMRGEIWLDD
jgi:protein-disulfide isomerase